MLKEQTKVYSGEEGFSLGPSIVEVDLRADCLRGVTSRLEGVNPGEIWGYAPSPPGETKSIRGPVKLREQATSSGTRPAGPC
jgi:hypothetical protein